MSEFDEHNNAGQSAENTQQESPVQDIIARTQEIMADLKAKKQEMLDADAALEKAHESKREIMRIGIISQRLFADCLKMFSRGEDYLEVGEPAGGSGLHVRLRPAKPARKHPAKRK